MYEDRRFWVGVRLLTFIVAWYIVMRRPKFVDTKQCNDDI